MRELERFDAVLFDLDGVITSTAEQHFSAWKQTFDDFLHRRAEHFDERFEPFQRDDYNRYVDGVPRYDGVRNFLAARGVDLEEGGPHAPPEEDTVHGLGNRKNDRVNQIIREQGVEPYEGSVALLHELRRRGVKTAIVSSSRNALTVLQAAGIAHLFDARVDGEVAAELGLPGKPAPDTFLAAAQRLSVPPERAVVVEDALSGVEAGRDGGFGLVIGVDRVGQAQALRGHGADLVVSDLAELVE
ncbi:MAG: beta-phosphoglucomutase family hydrolase [Actinomycetota bacterium]|nr:beta-phosphoglucomutase family hydrolase [Actinomycetota bacterium]